ncbi:hypothetical protein [Pararhizobium haloflavum]|uniref:hypothetical protein n=1 Tax=Pararhizobium haloflavum TaxID=2037914 RepID=UPI000C18DC5E|nr:hypothetical protein [Pararhizobium haloflavum]
MEHIAAIMVLIGCGHGDIDCKELPAPTVGYETVELCERDMEHVLRGASNNHPIVYGQCSAVDPALFEQDAVVAWDFDERGDLRVDVVPSDSLYASTDPAELVAETPTAR